MRVRTAHVELLRADGVKAVFEKAVDRRLAWIVGTGHAYADLEKVANKKGYLLNNDEDTENWVAVRRDLVHDEITYAGNGIVAFAASRDDLGSVGIGADDVSFNKVGDEERLKQTVVSDPVKTDDYVYAETLYRVAPLKN